jgi:hypothetical protein
MVDITVKAHGVCHTKNDFYHNLWTVLITYQYWLISSKKHKMVTLDGLDGNSLTQSFCKFKTDLKIKSYQAPVAHACNHSYSGDRNQEVQSSKPAPSK